MPKGCDPRGKARVRLTAKLVASTTLMLAPCLFVTHTMPFGATASVRGAAPTAISASFARVTASNTETVSLSWFTTHKRALPLAGCCSTRLDDTAGFCAVPGR